MKKLSPEVEKLITATIERIGQHATVDNVLEALTQGNITAVPRAPNVQLDAVKAFRKRRKTARLQFVEHVFANRRQATLPSVGSVPEPVAATASLERSQPPQNPAPQSVALAEIGRNTGLELKEEMGEVYITLRCFEQLIGKRPENLKRTLEARGFPIVDLDLPNAAGNTRKTPCVHTDYIFAVVTTADLHGMDDAERQKLFYIQRNMPTWMRRFEAAKTLAQAPKPEEQRPLLTKGGVMISVANLAAAVAEKVVHVISDFANRLDLRLDRIEKLVTPAKAPPVQAPTNGTLLHPKFPAPPNKYGVVKPFINAQQMLEKFDTDFCHAQRNFGIDSPEAIVRLAANLGIFKTQHWGRIVGADEWEFDAGKEALTAYTYMKDYLHKNIVATNSQPTSFSS